MVVKDSSKGAPHMTGSDAYALAHRKARYAHRDWIVWKDRDGDYHAEEATASSVKSALLAIGTKGYFTCVDGKGISYHQTWATSILWHKNLKKGYIA
jgi:hypothetical protein